MLHLSADLLFTQGGGSFATQDVESCAIVIRCDSDKAAEALSARMRNRPVPVLARIKGREVRVNVRTVLPYEDSVLGEALTEVLAKKNESPETESVKINAKRKNT